MEGPIAFPVPQFDFPLNEHDDPPITITFEEVSPPSSANLQDQQVWNDLDRFYLENQQKIESSLILSRDGTEDINHVVDALGGLLEGASLILEGLVALGNVHPVLGVAIFAFHGIVKLDLARRDNDRKVLAVVLQMQNMMGAMFQLRELKATSLSQAKKNLEKGALEKLVENIARDITVCRGNLIYYSKRKLVSKLIKSKSYEKMFADHIQVFTLRRSELQLTIASYIAAGVNGVNVSIADVQNKLDSIDKSMGAAIQDILRRLSTKEEHSMLDFIDRNGGPQSCVDNSELLSKLLAGTGESISTGKTGENDLKNWRNSLKDELTQELTDALQNHQTRFEKLLNIQNNNMKRMSEQLEDQVQLISNHGSKLDNILHNLSTVMVYEQGRIKRKAVKLRDPEIQEAWERMELDRRSVKAKRFVLTFRDHILTGYSMPPTPRSRPAEIQDGLLPTPSTLLFSESTTSSSFGETLTLAHRNPDTESNRWLLEYIDVSYVKPIVEAIDEDVSGFISVHEASKFALARPKELSLLHWMAYWAAGWHMTLANYQWHIHRILLEMYNIRPSIIVSNRVPVEDYLTDTAFRRVECLLRSLTPLPKQIIEDDKLRDISISIADTDMQRLNLNLKEFSFLLESASDVVAVGGEARIETWILPLLYLVLNCHLAVLKLGTKIALDISEFDAHINTLKSIFSSFDERMHSLQGKFRHMDRDIESQFEKFAHGMFYASFKKQEEEPTGNITLYQSGVFIYALNAGDTEPRKDGPSWDLSTLCKPRGPTFAFEHCKTDVSTEPSDGGAIDALEGSWMCFRDLNETFSMTTYPPGNLQLIISSIEGDKIKGTAVGHFGTLDIIGNVDSCKSPCEVVLKLVATGRSPIVLKGQYLSDKDVITGLWAWIDDYLPGSPPDLPVANSEDVNGQSELSQSSEETPMAFPISSSDAEEHDIASGTFKTSSDNDHEHASDEEHLQNDPALRLIAGEVSLTEKSQEMDSNKVDQSKVSESIELQDDVNIPVVSAEGVLLQEERYLKDVSFGQNLSAGSFSLRRTPPDDAARFIHFLVKQSPETKSSASAWNVPRRRWAYAISAVRENVSRQMGSQRLFRERLAESRQWLDFSQRLRLPFYVSFSETDLDTWFKLIRTVPPQDARLYESIASYLTRRRSSLFGGHPQQCDKCEYTAVGVYYQCLVCISDDMKRRIILCANCHDKPSNTTKKNFVHKLSHSLIRSTRLLHMAHLEELINRERGWDLRLKKRFRHLETYKKTEENQLQETVSSDLLDSGVMDRPPPTCGCCNKEVNPPCYVCTYCPLFFMCLECQNNHIPLMKYHDQFDEHRPDHHLLLIRDSMAETKTKTDYERLEQQFLDMESRFNQKLATGLSTLEKNIQILKIQSPHVNDSVSAMSVNDSSNVSAILAKPYEQEPIGDPDVQHISDEGGQPEQPGPSTVSMKLELQEGPTVSLLSLKLEELMHKQSTLENKTLEQMDRIGKLESQVEVLGTKVEDRLTALEGKVGVLISLLQDLVHRPEH